MEKEAEGKVAGGAAQKEVSTTSASSKPPLLPGGGRLEAGAATSTSSAEVDLEGTLNSNASKEFSFGTTKPAQLPPASELAPMAAVSQVEARPQPARVQETQSSQPDELDGAALTEAPAGSAKPPQDAACSPKSEAGEMFTFGTTTPLQLPDPASLRQVASEPDAALMPAVERNSDRHATPAAGSLPLPSGTLPTPERRTPRWEPSDHQHTPLPPVQEVSQPTLPQQIAEQSVLDLQVALPEQVPQPAPRYPEAHATRMQHWQTQQASAAQAAQQWQMQQAQNWQEEMQKQQREAAELAEATKIQEQQLAHEEGYGPYINGEEEEGGLKVQEERSKKPLVAAGCIVVLAVLAVGAVVLFVQTT